MNQIPPRSPDNTTLAAWVSANPHYLTELSCVAQSQWVAQRLGNMILRCMLTRIEPPRMVDRDQFLTADGTHVHPDSSAHPIYRFEIRGVVIKLRHLADRWDAQIWADDRIMLPAYLLEPTLTRSMPEEEDAAFMKSARALAGEPEPAYAFQVGNNPEALYAILWALCDAFRTLLDDASAMPYLATEVAPSAVPEEVPSRAEVAKGEMIRRSLAERPEMLPEVVARHYTSLATTAMQLRAALDFRRQGGPGNVDEMIKHYVNRLRQCHINDFGVAPNWSGVALGEVPGSGK